MPMRSTTKQFVICIENEGYEVSLERRKIYQALPDPDAAKHRQIRVIDESGEDYLYPAAYFVDVTLAPPSSRGPSAVIPPALPSTRSRPPGPVVAMFC